MNKHDILDDQQIKQVTSRLKNSLSDIVEHAERSGISVEDTVRYLSLGSRLEAAREDNGLSIKEVSKRLRVPQYRIRDAESNAKKVVGAVLEKYVRLVGQEGWYEEWARVNTDLARRISLQEVRRK